MVNVWCKRYTMPSLKLTFSHLKMDGWKTSLSFRGPAYFPVRTVSIREGIQNYHLEKDILGLTKNCLKNIDGNRCLESKLHVQCAKLSTAFPGWITIKST